MTLVFPDSSLNGATVLPPNPGAIPLLDNDTIRILPPSKNILTPVSQEKTIAISIPYKDAPTFSHAIRELPGSHASQNPPLDGKRWMMSAVKGEATGQQRSFPKRVSDAWTAFVDLLKVGCVKRVQCNHD